MGVGSRSGARFGGRVEGAAAGRALSALPAVAEAGQNAHSVPRQETRRGPRILRDLPPMDAEQVVLAAARLTRKHGLETWTMRQLADELECSPAVIYHHVGGREVVTRAVVDHVVGTLSSAYASTHWRDWFSAVLMEMRVVFHCHRGVAGWLIARGPVLPAMLRILEKGVALLRREGLGPEASDACSVLIDVALSRLAAEELRDDDDDLGAEIDHALTRYRGSTERRGLVAVAGLLGHRRTHDYYRFAVECALDGVAMRIAENRHG